MGGDDDGKKFATRAIHVGTKHYDGSVNTPIFQSSTYKLTEETYANWAKGAQHTLIYSRLSSVNSEAVVEKLVSLEKAEDGELFSSGMAAISTTLLGLFSKGDHIVASSDVYGGTYGLMTEDFTRFGIEISMADMRDVTSYEVAIQENTKALYIETLTNPVLKVCDIAAFAKLAKQQGALTIAVVTYPFNSEGTMRRQHAEWGLERLRDICDTVVVMPNERLLHVDGVKDLPIGAAFRVADELLMRSIAGISELITKDGLVNLDFMDLKSVMENGGGVAMIGLGESTGMNRATEATMQALESPLLDIDVSDARGALINVVCGPSLTLGEAEEAASLIKSRINPNAKIIWGATVDESMKEELRVMVVLTGVRSQHIFGAAATNQLKALKHRSIEFVN